MVDPCAMLCKQEMYFKIGASSCFIEPNHFLNMMIFFPETTYSIFVVGILDMV